MIYIMRCSLWFTSAQSVASSVAISAIVAEIMGINLLLRCHSHHKLTLEIEVFSRRLAKYDFLNLCVDYTPGNPRDVVALGLVLQELRITTEPDWLNMWCKFKLLRD